MEKGLNWLIDKWLAGFLTASIFFTAKIYVDLPADKKANFSRFAWLHSIANFEIMFWVVAVIVAFVIAMFQLSKCKAKQTTPQKKKVPPNPFVNYSSDKFGVNDALWAWSYKYDIVNETWNIATVAPLCPTCGNEMEITNFTTNVDYANCSKCRLDGKQPMHTIYQRKSDVRQEIIRRGNELFSNH